MNKEIGKKAESLLSLKEKGLFNENLLILSELPKKQEFFKLLLSNKFTSGSNLAVRFSSPSKTINLPRSIILDSFDKVYEFIESNINGDLTTIIHDFVTPEFSGSLIKKNNKIYLSLIHGVWESESSKSCDNIIISKNNAKIFLNPEEKECLFVNKEKLDKKTIQSNEQEITRIIKELYSQIKELDFKEGILYEFIISQDNNLTIMEYKQVENFNEFDGDLNVFDFFEISKYSDIKKWDKVRDLVLSVPVTRENDLEFIKMIEEIKKLKDKVYVTYGLCSHPSILLREFGINVIPFNEKRKIIEIELN